MQFFILAFSISLVFLFLGYYLLLREVKYVEQTEGNEAVKKDIKRIKKIIIIWFLLVTPFIIYLSLLGEETFHQKIPYTLAMLYMAFAVIILSEGALLFWVGKNGIFIKHRNEPKS